MSAHLEIAIAGIGAWTRGAPDWPALRALLRGERGLRDDAPQRPAATALPPAERRRTPDSVLLAVEAAQQACAMAGIDPATLPCVFASTHGELAITDYMGTTLAAAPRELSPTRFHNSVHNAPVGYWTIATQCTAASSATTAHHASLGAGLLEAATLCRADVTPVLFAACDIASVGALADMTRTTRAFAAAWVLTPDTRRAPRLALATRAGAIVAPVFDDPALAAMAADNPLTAHALALLAALAAEAPARLTLPAASALLLDMEVVP